MDFHNPPAGLCSRCIEVFGKLQPLRFLKTQALLKLQRTHCRQRTEMMVEARCAHPGVSGKVIDTKRLREITLHPIYRPCNMVTPASCLHNLPESQSLVTHEQAIINFTLNKRCKDRKIRIFFKQLDQPLKSIEKGGLKPR
jgi:hypothetical protein